MAKEAACLVGSIEAHPFQTIPFPEEEPDGAIKEAVAFL